MQVLVTIGLILFVVNLTYWLVMFRVVGNLPKIANPIKNEVPVALIIIAHNDLDALKFNLTGCLEQIHNNYSVIVVDDGSSDGTTEWLQDQAGLYKHLEVFTFDKRSPGKKESLAKILEQRQEQIVVLTDADCQPASKLWLSKVAGTLEKEEAGIFIGYGPLQKTKSWTNKLARFETLTTALNYLTWSSLGYTYMGVGRNLAYHKDVYENYSIILPEVASGDDDLFVQSVAQTNKTVTTLDPDTFVYSKSPQRISQWLNQKSRHVSTSFDYKWPIKVGLGWFGASQFWWIFLVIWCWKVFICLLVAKWLLFTLAASKVMRTLDCRDLLIFWPFMEISLSLSYILILPWSWFRKSDQW